MQATSLRPKQAWQFVKDGSLSPPCYLGYISPFFHAGSGPAWICWEDFKGAFSARLPRPLRLVSIRHLAIKNGDGAGPAGGGPLDLHRKARHHEAGRGQKLQIVQLLDMAIADMAPRLVTFPDQAGLFCLGVF